MRGSMLVGEKQGAGGDANTSAEMGRSAAAPA